MPMCPLMGLSEKGFWFILPLSKWGAKGHSAVTGHWSFVAVIGCGWRHRQTGGVAVHSLTEYYWNVTYKGLKVSACCFVCLCIIFNLLCSTAVWKNKCAYTVTTTTALSFTVFVIFSSPVVDLFFRLCFDDYLRFWPLCAGIENYMNTSLCGQLLAWPVDQTLMWHVFNSTFLFYIKYACFCCLFLNRYSGLLVFDRLYNMAFYL